MGEQLYSVKTLVCYNFAIFQLWLGRFWPISLNDEPKILSLAEIAMFFLSNKFAFYINNYEYDTYLINIENWYDYCDF